MDSLDQPALRQRIDAFIQAHDGDVLTWVEIHGLLCAMAVGPEAPEDWAQAIHAEEDCVPAPVVEALEQLRDRLAGILGAGERFQLPCRLDPYAEREGEDLASWCTGFMCGVMQQEEAWYARDEAQMAQWLLPFLLISGLDEDPEMDALWQDSRLVRQMAQGIPDLLEEMFLFHQGLEAPRQDSADGEDTLH